MIFIRFEHRSKKTSILIYPVLILSIIIASGCGRTEDRGRAYDINREIWILGYLLYQNSKKKDSNKSCLGNSASSSRVRSDGALPQHSLPTDFRRNRKKLPSENRIPGELVIRLKHMDGEDKSQIIRQQFSRMGEIRGYQRFRSGDMMLLHISEDVEPDLLIERIRSNQNVESVGPNFIYRMSRMPDDPEFLAGNQWGLKNPVRFITDEYPIIPYEYNGVEGVDINATEAWEKRTDCSEVTVAVLDTGIHYNHEDLAASMWSDESGYHGYDFIQLDHDPMDENGHGSHVAGIIGAVGNNTTGITGVCWKASLMAVRVLNQDGDGSTYGISSGIRWAVEHNARILNMSLGTSSFDSTMFNALYYARENGVIVTVAAGNETQDNDETAEYPASYDLDNIISVTSMDPDGVLSFFANFGKQSVDLAAPGAAVRSSVRYEEDWILDDFSGSVDGAGVWNLEGDWSVTEDCRIEAGFLSSVDILGAPPWCPEDATKPADAPDYKNNSTDKAYNTYDMTGTDKVYFGYYVDYTMSDGEDSLTVAFKNSAGDPFSGGIRITDYTGITDPSLLLHESYRLDQCTNSVCSTGFQMNSNASIVDRSPIVALLHMIRMYESNDQYRYEVGTSMAAPFIAGIAALLVAEYPQADYLDVIQSIFDSVEVTDDLEDYTCTGGWPDAARALELLGEK